LHTPPCTLSIPRPPTQLILSSPPKRKPKTLPPDGFMTLTTCPPLATYDFEPKAFFDAQREGLTRVAINDFEAQSHKDDDNKPIEKFVRSPNGSAVAVMRKSSVNEAWILDDQKKLRRMGRWKGSGPVIILDDSRIFFLFCPIASDFYHWTDSVHHYQSQSQKIHERASRSKPHRRY
jgi:hypothetical protein